MTKEEQKNLIVELTVEIFKASSTYNLVVFTKNEVILDIFNLFNRAK